MKKLTLVMIAVLVILLVVPIACARAPEPAPVPAPMPAPAAPPPAPEIIIPAPKPAPAPAPAPRPPEQAVAEVGQTWATQRMIVRTGSMWLVVADVPTALDQIAKLAGGFDGYVVSSKRWQEGERLAGTITIRVLAEHFDDTIRALRELAVDVTSEDTSSKDVTEEYVDLSAKLHNLEATEQQLLEIMEKAEKVEDILNVQRELSRTRGEIEQTKGRMQYLEQTSTTSLIEVRLEQAELDVNFTANRKTVKEGQEVWFEARIAGGFAPYSYEWDFGDGETSTSEFPSHAYKSAGNYTVSLKVTDDRGNTDTRTRDGYITVRPGWRAGSIASGAWNGLVTFGHVLADIFIWIGIFSPVWIVIGGIVYLIYRWRRRRKRV